MSNGGKVPQAVRNEFLLTVFLCDLWEIRGVMSKKVIVLKEEFFSNDRGTPPI